MESMVLEVSRLEAQEAERAAALLVSPAPQVQVSDWGGTSEQREDGRAGAGAGAVDNGSNSLTESHGDGTHEGKNAAVTRKRVIATDNKLMRMYNIMCVWMCVSHADVCDCQGWQ